MPPATGPDYSTAKAAINAITASMSKAVAADDITVNAISPGTIKSAKLEDGFRAAAQARSPDTSAASTFTSMAASRQSPTEIFECLIGEPALWSWRDRLRHQLELQGNIRRQAEFRPPAPRAVAAALLSGPPATPGDLRAVISECLGELAHDIRHAATSPWKGFWNRPYRKLSSPKDENDCRDLLVDRLSDRLRRFQIPVRSSKTEDRSGNDRRVDVLILGKDSAAAIPLEAKRHYNAELWTSVEDQLLPYCRTAGSNGHGIYLIFWFGPVKRVPPHPHGLPAPTTADALQTMLTDQLPGAYADTIKIVVIDVSEPAKPGKSPALTKNPTRK